MRAGLGDGRPDFILWTRTGWDLGAEQAKFVGSQWRLLVEASKLGVPVVGYHLDIWWGLKRQHLVTEEPFFQSDLVITADGGHDPDWAREAINHLWMPPGISLGEAEVGHTRTEFRSKLAFVGSHDGGYHAEHRHRHELVDWLRRNFRRDCLFFPMPGQPAVRGRDLQDLYASVDVVVGDSCFAGTGLENYWSDRIPETLGRGGFLLHPNVPGLEKHFKDGEHLCTWEAFDWEGLGTLIETALSSPEDRADITTTARYHVREHHTYERRVEQIVDALYERNLLR